MKDYERILYNKNGFIIKENVLGGEVSNQKNIIQKNYLNNGVYLKKNHRIRKKNRHSDREKILVNNNFDGIIDNTNILKKLRKTKKRNKKKKRETQFSLKPPYSVEEVMDDLLLRFVLNFPQPKSKIDLEKRLFFQLEKAHWFYLDYHKERKNTEHQLPYLNFYNFIKVLFSGYVCLMPYQKLYKRINNFKQYKYSVPVCGCILLNKDLTRILLVQSIVGSSWGFPKGKINDQESPHDCARRETVEEIGYDVSKKIDVNQYIEVKNDNNKISRYYIITGVDELYKFKPQHKNEIGIIGWHKIDHMFKYGGKEYKYITKEIKRLKIWVYTHRKLRKQLEMKKMSNVKIMKKPIYESEEDDYDDDDYFSSDDDD